MEKTTVKRNNGGDIHPPGSPKRANISQDDIMDEEVYGNKVVRFTQQELEAAKDTPWDDEMYILNEELSTPIQHDESTSVSHIVHDDNISHNKETKSNQYKKTMEEDHSMRSVNNMSCENESNGSNSSIDGVNKDNTQKKKNTIDDTESTATINGSVNKECSQRKVKDSTNNNYEEGNKATQNNKDRQAESKTQARADGNNPNDKIQDSLHGYFTTLGKNGKRNNKQDENETSQPESEGNNDENQQQERIDPRESEFPLPFFVPDDQEDDHNTIDSGNTTVQNNTIREEQENNLYYWRFRLVMELPEVPKELLEKKKNGEAVPDEKIHNIPRIRKMLGTWLEKFLDYNPEAAFLPWSKSDFQSYIPSKKAIPKSLKKMQPYFNNLRSREKGRLYLNVRFFLNHDLAHEMAEEFTEWLENEFPGSSMTPSLVQAERSEDIGWLAYSYEHTNTKILSRWLTKQVGCSVGCRLQGVVPSELDAEKPIPWYQRTRAIVISCDYDRADEIKSKLHHLIGAKNSSNVKAINGKSRLNYAKNFVFLPMEDDVKKMVHVSNNYTRMQERHIIHSKTIRSKFFGQICKRVDTDIPTRLGHNCSLREMILKIPAREHNITNRDGSKFTSFIPLFQGFDYTVKSGKEFYKNNGKTRKGPGGKGFIFSYYECNEKEALQMIQGIGVYLAKIYGRRTIQPYFSINYWDQVFGWRWNSVKNTFVTPEAKHMEEIVEEDNNMMIVNMERVANATSKRRTESNIPSPNKYLKDGEKALLTVFADPDQDSLHSLSAPPKVTDEISMPKNSNNEDTSIASSITMGSDGSSIIPEKSAIEQKQSTAKEKTDYSNNQQDSFLESSSIDTNHAMQILASKEGDSSLGKSSNKSSGTSFSLRSTHLDKLMKKNLSLDETKQILKKAREFQLRKLDDQIASIEGQLEEKQQQELRKSNSQSTDLSDSSSDSRYTNKQNNKGNNQEKGANHNSIVTPTKVPVNQTNCTSNLSLDKKDITDKNDMYANTEEEDDDANRSGKEDKAELDPGETLSPAQHVQNLQLHNTPMLPHIDMEEEIAFDPTTGAEDSGSTS